MAENRFSGYTASFTHAGGTLDLRQLTGMTIAPGSRRAVVLPAGLIDPKAHVLANADPSARISSRALGAVLTTVSLGAGLACTGGAGLRFQKRAAYGSAFESTGAFEHLILSSTNGFLYIDSIEVDGSNDTGATANLVYVPLSSSGLADPLIAAMDQALTGISAPAFQEVFFAGPVYLAGVTQIAGLMRWRLSTGLRVEALRQDGHVWPTGVAVIRRDPMFDLTFLRAETVKADFNHLWGELQTLTCDVFLRKGSQTTAAGRVADASSNHIKLSFTTSHWGPQNISFAGESDALAQINIMSESGISSSVTSTVP